MSQSPWFSVPRQGGAHAMRLFCFPYAGGGASVYRAWAETLGDGIELVAVQPPGRESRFAEPALTDLPELIEQLRDAIAPMLAPRFAFFGHSLGALVSFELARALRRAELPLPDTMFVSGRRAPQVPIGRPAFHRLDDQALVSEIRRLGGDTHRLLDDDEMRTLLLPAARADFALHDTYEYREEHPLEVRMFVFSGLDDHTTSDANLRAWQEQCEFPVALSMFEGDHFFIDRSRPEVLRTISASLDPRPMPERNTICRNDCQWT